MSKFVTISIVVNEELRRLLESWAAQEDRSLSATLRQILAREADRRQRQPNQQQQQNNAN